MRYDVYKRSGLSRHLWLGLAIFFVVFSCPVKKYIRLQLYKHTPLTESTSGPQIATKDVKDCSIADKHNQLQVMPPPVVQRFAGGNGDTHFASFYLPLFISLASLLLFKRKDEEYLVGDQSPGATGTVPLYLQYRHLQV